jgi:hypothetical protein
MLEFETPLASPADFDIPRCVANSDEAIEIIRAHREKWTASGSLQATAGS